jgi:AMIN domain
VPSIRSMQVLRSAGQVEIEIEASDRVVPRTNVLSNPDRLVVDFVNALPGSTLRNQAVNRAEVKNLRVGLFSANPPVTRIVADLNGPQPYQVFPSGRTVIVKVGGVNASASAARPSGPVLLNANFPTQAVQLPTPVRSKPALEVSFENGLLSISSNKASLSEVLFAIHQRTGAEIAIPSGAEQEQVVTDVGPAPAPEVLAHLLNGSKFNFLILSSSNDPTVLDRVILSSRPEGPAPPPPPRSRAEIEAEEEPVPQPKIAPPVPEAPDADKPASSTDAPKTPTGETDTTVNDPGR